jgi:serine/threonine protein kinase
VLPWWLRLRVAAQVSAAIAYLHSLPASAGGPLIHRDIKPANMFLDGRLNAKVRGCQGCAGWVNGGVEVWGLFVSRGAQGLKQCASALLCAPVRSVRLCALCAIRCVSQQQQQQQQRWT